MTIKIRREHLKYRTLFEIPRRMLLHRTISFVRPNGNKNTIRSLLRREERERKGSANRIAKGK